jgi:hypothetical protein
MRCALRLLFSFLSYGHDETCFSQGVPALRVGQPVKVRPELRDATLDMRLLHHPMQVESVGWVYL